MAVGAPGFSGGWQRSDTLFIKYFGLGLLNCYIWIFVIFEFVRLF